MNKEIEFLADLGFNPLEKIQGMHGVEMTLKEILKKYSVKSKLFGVGIELPTSTQLLSDCKDRFKDLKANNYKFDYRSYLNGYLDSFSKYTISNKQR